MRHQNSPRLIRAAAPLFARAPRSRRGRSRPQVFADQRYQRHDKRDKLPGWITSHLRDAHLNLSTDMLLHVAREFMRAMAQPYDRHGAMTRLLTGERADTLGAPAAAALA